jgi:hypothetical protein
VTINVKLSTGSILKAIHRLQQAKQNLRFGLDDTVDILTKEGAEIAQIAYGDMANAVGYMEDEATGIIATSGEANIIAEFGAGDATEIPTGFENMPDTPVYPGSYSELVGSGEYYTTMMETGEGRWHFGGVEYHEVQPRNGLMKAKAYIVASAENIAKEVIKL